MLGPLPSRCESPAVSPFPSIPTQTTPLAPTSGVALDVHDRQLSLLRPSSTSQFVVTVQLATKFVDSEGKAGNFDPDSRAVLAPQLSECSLQSDLARFLIPRSCTPNSLSLTSMVHPFTGEAWMPAKTQRVLLFFGGGSPTSPTIKRSVSNLRSLDLSLHS